jgi:hypothetical protein
MELFLPSVLVLLLAAAVVFFVFPSFGPSALAIVSVLLLTLGVYQHWVQFGTEYRLSTWWLSLVAYAPYVMVGGLLIAIAIYLLYLLPANSQNSTAPSNVPMPTVANMPSANSSTNPVTAGINRALNSAANMGNSLNRRNNKTLGFPPSQV